MSSSLGVSLAGGALLRVGMLAWGRYQDASSSSTIRFEDIDYSVFQDAARLLVSGCPLSESLKVDVEDALFEPNAYGPHLACARGPVPVLARFLLQSDPRQWPSDEVARASEALIFRFTHVCFRLFGPVLRPLALLGDPYARPTYRYTPLLAALVSPTYLLPAWVPRDFGKWLFLGADLACGVLLWKLVQGRRRSISLRSASRLVSALWFFNPFPAQIAARGSAESIIGVLILLFLWLFLQTNPELAPEGNVALEATTQSNGSAKTARKVVQPVAEAAEPLSEWSLECLAAPIVLAFAAHFKLFPIIYGAPIIAHLYASSGRRSAAVARFTFVAGASFIAITAAVWLLWGTPSLDHGIFYHLSRKDHRHNFSPYFLPTYLSTVPSVIGTFGSSADQLSSTLPPALKSWLLSPLLSFAPQLLVVGVVGLSLGRKDFVAAIFAQTVLFVHWNKVVTSQYFLWYLWLLPLLLPTLRFANPGRSALLLAGVWAGSQALWLSQAHLLENKAQDTFLRVWLAGLLMGVAQVWVLTRLLAAWGRARLAHVDETKQYLSASK